jgi:hypothetical protein
MGRRKRGNPSPLLGFVDEAVALAFLKKEHRGLVHVWENTEALLDALGAFEAPG